MLLAFAAPAFAHHPFGGMTPNTWVQGFLSGVGHPVIGPDHLLFTIVIGLLATRLKPAWAIPLAFLAAALAGTGLHLMGLDLPAPEFSISLSVLIFGVLAVYGTRLNTGGGCSAHGFSRTLPWICLW
ncbi:MAG: HupE/UreJ family protein [Cyanobacteria bacterium P01_E01_bin.6]